MSCLIQSPAIFPSRAVIGYCKDQRNCRDADPVELPAGSRYIYKSFERVYAVRNNLSDNL